MDLDCIPGDIIAYQCAMWQTNSVPWMCLIIFDIIIISFLYPLPLHPIAIDSLFVS